jgi:hypothetical protein
METASVLELRSVPAEVVACYARPSTLDGLVNNDALAVRIAPDELLLLGERYRLVELENELRTRDPHGIVLDLSCAHSIWMLRGEDRFEAFRRLSELELHDTPAVVQGLVARVPAKIIVGEDELLLIVSSVLEHHIRERVLVACADLDLVERAAVEAVEEGALA